MKKALYVSLATITAPVWMPIAAVGYIAGNLGYTFLKQTIKRPKTVAATLALTGLLTYGLSTGKIQDVTKSSLAWHRERKAIASERKLEETNLEKEMLEIELREPFLSEEGYNFYYIKQGDTLSDISQKVSGYSSKYTAIAKDNRIENPRSITIGRLLRIREDLCTKYSADIYTKVPDLESMTTSKSVSSIFPEKYEDVLDLNNALGLDYQDNFPGTRVIHYTGFKNPNNPPE